jgi:hypothetical protein
MEPQEILKTTEIGARTQFRISPIHRAESFHLAASSALSLHLLW